MEILDATSEKIAEIEGSPQLAWVDIAEIDASLAVVLSRLVADGTGPREHLDSPVSDGDGTGSWLTARAVAQMRRVETVRCSLAALETDTEFIDRCASGLAALVDLPVGFTPGAEVSHVPAWVGEDSAGFSQWRDDKLFGFTPLLGPSPWDEVVTDTRLANSDLHSRLVVFVDWVDAVLADRDGWSSQLVVEAVGRYGTFVNLQNPRAALLIVPTVASRFMLSATLGRYPMLPMEIDTSDRDGTRAMLSALLANVGCDGWISDRAEQLARFGAEMADSGALLSAAP